MRAETLFQSLKQTHNIQSANTESIKRWILRKKNTDELLSGEEAFPLCSEIAALSLTTLSPGTGLGAIVWGVVCKSVCVCVCIILVNQSQYFCKVGIYSQGNWDLEKLSVVLTLQKLKDSLMIKRRKKEENLSHLLQAMTHQGVEKLGSKVYVLPTMPLRHQPFFHSK